MVAFQCGNSHTLILGNILKSLWWFSAVWLSHFLCRVPIPWVMDLFDWTSSFLILSPFSTSVSILYFLGNFNFIFQLFRVSNSYWYAFDFEFFLSSKCSFQVIPCCYFMVPTFSYLPWDIKWVSSLRISSPYMLAIFSKRLFLPFGCPLLFKSGGRKSWLEALRWGGLSTWASLWRSLDVSIFRSFFLG